MQSALVACGSMHLLSLLLQQQVHAPKHHHVLLSPRAAGQGLLLKS